MEAYLYHTKKYTPTTITALWWISYQMSNLSNIVNVTPVANNKISKVVVQQGVGIEQHAEQDFETARTAVLEAIETVSKVAEDAAGISLAAQNPKQYDSVATLIRAKIDGARALADIHKVQTAVRKDRAEELADPENPSSPKNLLIVTTAELQSLIKKHGTKDITPKTETKADKG